MKKNLLIIIWLVTLIGIVAILVLGRNLSQITTSNQNILDSQIITPAVTIPEAISNDIPENSELSTQVDSIVANEEAIALVLPMPDDPPVSLWRPP